MDNYKKTIIKTPSGCEIEIMRPILNDIERQRRTEILKATASDVLKRVSTSKKIHNERTDTHEKAQKSGSACQNAG